MKILKSALLLILLAGGATAQVTATTSDKPDLEVLQITWRRVDHNPMLNDRPIPNPERAQIRAVNSARMQAAQQATRNNPGRPVAPALLAEPSVPDMPPVVRPWTGFIYEFKVRNTGEKTIRKVAWEYSFSDPGTKKKVGKRSYKSKVKVLPGATASLTVRSSQPPIGTIDAKRAGTSQMDQSPEQMVIQRIEYTDGSVWKRDSK